MLFNVSNSKYRFIGGGPEVRPEWIRLPRKGHFCPYCGLSRSSLNELILPTLGNGGKPPVHSVCVRQRNKLRGARLINFDSLMAFLASQAHSDAGEAQASR
jgi:hypothetical protein